MLVKKRRASARADGGLEFILSDATPDHLGDIIEPAGWDLTTFQENPVALFNHRGAEPIGQWDNVRVEGGALRGTLRLAEPGITRIDELRALVEQGILRAASVGFTPLEYETYKRGEKTGIHFKRQRLLETSLVSIPANPNALTVARSLSAATRDLVFGDTAEDDVARQQIIGKHAATKPIKRVSTMNLQEQIEASQASLVALKDQLAAHVKTCDDNDVSDQFLTINSELNAKVAREQAKLDSLKESEALLAKTSQVAVQRPTVFPPVYAAPKPPEPKPGERALRALVAMVHSKGAGISPEQAMAARYGADGKCEDRSLNVLRALARPDGIHLPDVIQRAAIIPADTTTSGWASQLVQTDVADFMPLLMPASVYPGLAAKGLSLSFGRSGIISIPTRVATPTIAGSFVGEGSPIPVKQGAFSAQTLTPKKMAVISTFTRQIAEHSTPAIEGLIRNAIAEDTATAVDVVLLDATAASAIRPAGIRNGVSVTTATAGGGFAALVGDVKNLVAALITGSNGNVRMPVWIMNPIQALAISLTQNAGGDFPFKNEINNKQFQGFPVIVSSTVTAGMVILVDAADFVTVNGDAPRYDVSDQATIHMDDSPSQISTVGTPNVVAAPVRSMWQTDCIALRMIWDVNWAMRRSGVVAWTQAVTW